MGVRGLTTYIDRKKEFYFSDFQLQNSPLVIDGNSFAAYLYNSELSPAYGGDYHSFGEIVNKVMTVFKRCNVTPIVVFDGGVEQRKLKTNIKRLTQKVYGLESVSPEADLKYCFPLMLRHAFKRKLIEMGISCVQSDYEADSEIACLAQKLKCPVLSSDSDFYIFDVLYIPLSSVNFACSTTFVPCQMFRADRFLFSLGDLEREKLPLLAAVLGNDYFTQTHFSRFFCSIKLERVGRSLSQRRVGGMVKWLKSQTEESALQTILSALQKPYRPQLLAQIKFITSGYVNLSTDLDKYIPEGIEPSEVSFTDDALPQEDESDSAEVDSADELSNEEESTEPEFCSKFDDCNEFPLWFLDLSRRCLIPPALLTLVNLKSYFCQPQPEWYDMPHSGEIALPLVQRVAGLVLGRTKFKYWSRQNRRKYYFEMLDTVESEELKFNELNALSLPRRKDIIKTFLHVDGFEVDVLPEEWQLLVMALVYWIKNSDSLKAYNVHAVLTMALAVNVVRRRVGSFKSKKAFLRKYEVRLSALKEKKSTASATDQPFSSISFDDCLLFCDSIIPLFPSESLRRPSRLFTLSIIHAFAQLQECIQLSTMLNALFGYPYKDVDLCSFYDGTLLHNFASNFKKRPNVLSYIEVAFDRTPTLMAAYKFIFGLIEPVLANLNEFEVKSVRKKKTRRKCKVKTELVEHAQPNSDSDNFFDENNSFSALRIR